MNGRRTHDGWMGLAAARLRRLEDEIVAAVYDVARAAPAQPVIVPQRRQHLAEEVLTLLPLACETRALDAARLTTGVVFAVAGRLRPRHWRRCPRPLLCDPVPSRRLRSASVGLDETDCASTIGGSLQEARRLRLREQPSDAVTAPVEDRAARLCYLC